MKNKTVLWEGKFKIEGVVGDSEETLSFNTEEFNFDWLYEIIKKLKPNWKSTVIYCIIGELERIKLDLLVLCNEGKKNE